MSNVLLMSYYPATDQCRALVSIHNGGGSNTYASFTFDAEVFTKILVAKNLVFASSPAVSPTIFKFYGDDGIALYVSMQELIPYFGTRAPEHLECCVKELWRAATLQDVNDIDFFFFVANPQPATSPA